MTNPHSAFQLKNVLMFTHEEPARMSSFRYLYIEALPEAAKNYENAAILPGAAYAQCEETLLSQGTVTIGDNTIARQSTLVIASDRSRLLRYRAAGFSVMWQQEDLMHVNTDDEIVYVTDYPCDLSDAYLNKVFCRQQALPLVIAETERMIIREITLADVPLLYDLYDDDCSRRFMEMPYPIEEELAYQQDYIKHQYGLYDYGLWVLMDKKSERLIGRAGISNRVINGVECQELGYIIHRDFRRQGYALEALQAVIDFAHNAKMEDLYILTDPENLPSREVAMRLGFTLIDQIGCEYDVFSRKLNY